jgi:poly-gamma-glutamate synthesis protein (capsule biosynthesis protein)
MPASGETERHFVRLFLCGDVMTGRGIDQVLPHPCPPQLHEDYVKSAVDYVRLAERANGPVAAPVDFAYVWGAALDELDRERPHARIVNLETSITRNETHAAKGINYRMSPDNAACLRAAGIDCCVLANNHVLDWEEAGLLETLETLDRLRITHAGAGRDLDEASAPAVLEMAGKGCRIVVFALASPTSGTPRRWAATADKPGVNLVSDLSPAAAARVAEAIAAVRRPGDIVVVSIHWGPNWGYDIAEGQRRFAHALVDRGDVSIVHGHSAHHAKGIEIYRNRLILHGCGDFLNDYEGIGGYEAYRGDLALIYFATVDAATRALVALEMVPLQIRRLQLAPAPPAARAWLTSVLDRESRPLGAHVALTPQGRLALTWPP